MKKNLVFFHPNIRDDGCKKTLEIYTDFLVNKFNVTLVTNTPNKNFLKNINSKVKIINLNNFFFNKIFILNELFCLMSLIKFFNKNTIIFSLDGYLVLLILKFLGTRFNLFVRIANPIPLENNYKILSTNPGSEIGIIDLFFLKYSDVTILYSDLYQNYLKRKYKVKNIIIIKNYFKKTKVKVKKRNTNPNIFFVGRLTDIKDPIFFLKNLIKISKIIKIKIHFVGEGPLLESLKKISKENNVSVKFHGFIKRPFEKISKKIDLFCLTSKHDGTPNVLGEAISKKIPCIAPKNVGCVNELMSNGRYGTLYQKGDSADFRKKIKYVLNNHKEINLKAEKAFEALDRYNLDNTLKKLEKKILTYFKNFY